VTDRAPQDPFLDSAIAAKTRNIKQKLREIEAAVERKVGERADHA
jgi:hypothetical protein